MITDNRERITPCLYIVRTQAGFKQAAKEFWNCDSKPDVSGYPTTYPSMVVFSDGYAGYNYVRANCYALNFITETIAHHEREHARGQPNPDERLFPNAGNTGNDQVFGGNTTPAGGDAGTL